MIPYVIESDKEGKGRSFSATLIANLNCEKLLSEPNSGTKHRPIWSMYAGSESELKPFINNLLLGKPAKPANRYNQDTLPGGGSTTQIEYLKSYSYQTLTQITSEGAVTTIFLSELFRLDTGFIDPNRIAFCLNPSNVWVSSQASLGSSWVESYLKSEITPEFAHYFCALAHLFVAFLDRRTKAPIVMDPKFFVRLMIRCFEEKLCSFHLNGNRDSFGVNANFQFYAYGVEGSNMAPPLVFCGSHETFEKVLVEETRTFFNT